MTRDENNEEKYHHVPIHILVLNRLFLFFWENMKTVRESGRSVREREWRQLEVFLAYIYGIPCFTEKFSFYHVIH